MTLKVPTRVARKVFENKPFVKDLRVKGVIEPDPFSNTTEQYFMTFMCPLAYAWVNGGPLLPPPSYRRVDGTWTAQPNFYSLRGASARTFLFDLLLTESMWSELFSLDAAGARVESLIFSIMRFWMI